MLCRENYQMLVQEEQDSVVSGWFSSYDYGLPELKKGGKGSFDKLLMAFRENTLDPRDLLNGLRGQVKTGPCRMCLCCLVFGPATMGSR